MMKKSFLAPSSMCLVGVDEFQVKLLAVEVGACHLHFDTVAQVVAVMIAAAL